MINAVGADTSYQQLTRLTAGPDSSVLVSGRFEGSVNFAAPNGTDLRDSANGKMCVIRIGTNGDYRWTITVGGSGGDISAGPTGFVVSGCGGDCKPGGGENVVTVGQTATISRYAF